MRLFVALSPPPEALAEVSGAVGRVREGWPDLRWTAPELWHVTLAFLGEVPDDKLPALSVRLARAAGRHPPMTLAFAAAGAFPSAKRANVLWLGLRGGEATLPKLAASLAAGAHRAGAREPERRRFHPHLTLGRARTGLDLRELVESLAAFEGEPWHAGTVHLVRSHLGPHVRYEPVDAWPLAGRG